MEIVVASLLCFVPSSSRKKELTSDTKMFSFSAGLRAVVVSVNASIFDEYPEIDAPRLHNHVGKFQTAIIIQSSSLYPEKFFFKTLLKIGDGKFTEDEPHSRSSSLTFVAVNSMISCGKTPMERKLKTSMMPSTTVLYNKEPEELIASISRSIVTRSDSILGN